MGKCYPLKGQSLENELFLCFRLRVGAQSLWLCPTLCDPMDRIAHQAPVSMGFCRQKYWSGLPSHSPGDLPDPGIKPASLLSPALADEFFTASATWGAPFQATGNILSQEVQSQQN